MKSQHYKVIFPSIYRHLGQKRARFQVSILQGHIPSNSRHLVLKRARFEILMLQGYIPLNFQSFGAKKGMLWNLSTMRSYSLRFLVIWDKKGHALKSQHCKVIFPSIFSHLGQESSRLEILILQGYIPFNIQSFWTKKDMIWNLNTTRS